MSNQHTYDFFFSYRRKDQELAKQLVLAIKKHRNPQTGRTYRVWFDEDEKEFGDSLDGQVEEGIQHSNTMIILISSGGISGFQQLEVAYAKKQFHENPARFVVALSPGVDAGLRKDAILAFLRNPILIGEDTSDPQNVLKDLEKWVTNNPIRFEKPTASCVLGEHGHKLVDRNEQVADFERIMMESLVGKTTFRPRFFFMYGKLDDQLHSLVDRFEHFEIPRMLKGQRAPVQFKQVLLGSLVGKLDDPAYDVSAFNAQVERETMVSLNAPSAITDLTNFSGEKGLNFLIGGIASDFSNDALKSLEKIVDFWSASHWSFNMPVHFFFLIEGEPKSGIGSWFSKELDGKALRSKFNAIKDKGGLAHTFPKFEPVEKEHVSRWRMIDPTLLKSNSLALWISEFFKHKEKRPMLDVEAELEQEIKRIRNERTIR